jgi:hypothetical protein
MLEWLKSPSILETTNGTKIKAKEANTRNGACLRRSANYVIEVKKAAMGLTRIQFEKSRASWYVVLKPLS